MEKQKYRLKFKECIQNLNVRVAINKNTPVEAERETTCHLWIFIQTVALDMQHLQFMLYKTILQSS